MPVQKHLTQLLELMVFSVHSGGIFPPSPPEQHAGSGTHVPWLTQQDLFADGGTDSSSFWPSQQERFLGILNSTDLCVTSNGFRLAKLARGGKADSAGMFCEDEGVKSK